MPEFKIAERRHSNYGKNLKRWNLFGDSYVGGQKYISNEDYLFSHKLEKHDYYKDRLKAAYYFNYCRPVVRTLNNFLFQETITRDFKGIIIDAQIDAYKKLMRIASLRTSIYGDVYGVVDAPKLTDEEKAKRDSGKLTKRDTNKYNPIIKLVNPQDFVDCSVDSNGNYNWVILRERISNDEDPHAEREDLERFRLWLRDGWELYDGDSKFITSDYHSLGEVPVVRVMNIDADADSVGESTLEDIAYVNRDIYNDCSLLGELIKKQTFSQLVAQGNATDYDGHLMSTSSIFTYPKGVNEPKYISPDAGQAELIIRKIERSIAEIYRLAELRISGREGRNQQYKSIAENVYDFSSTNVALKNKAAVMTSFELEILRLAAKWRGMNVQPVIQYPSEFDVTTLEQELADALTIETLGMGKTFERMIKMRIANKKFPDMSEKDKKQIEAEIMDDAELNTNQIPDDPNL